MLSSETDHCDADPDSSHGPGKQPRWSVPGLNFSRHGVSITALAAASDVDDTDHQDDDESLPYAHDVRDVKALVRNYDSEVTFGDHQPEVVLQSQTGFILGLVDANSRAVEDAVVDHFAPVPEADENGQAEAGVDRLPLPRPAIGRPFASLNALRTLQVGSRQPSPDRRYSASQHHNGRDSPLTPVDRSEASVVPQAAIGSWQSFLQCDAQDEIDEVFG